MPFPRESGQQQRVYYKLKALSRSFRVTFLGLEMVRRDEDALAQLQEICDRVVLLPRKYSRRRPLIRGLYAARALLSSLGSGLRTSNFIVGRLELTPQRVRAAVDLESFECALFEYWHAWRCVEETRAKQVYSVLDMHDFLWRSWDRTLGQRPYVPNWWRSWAVGSYRQLEQSAWEMFDALIAINAGERDEVKQLLPDHPVLFVPMGVDLQDWPYSWAPKDPARVVYYGGLGNPARQRDAFWAYRQVMPEIWQEEPDTEFWLIGSRPPESFLDLQRTDPRVRVTGYLPQVQDTLATASVLLCPWRGTFGFRSRLVEAMALGVPVVASPDAAWGMELVHGRGISLMDSDRGLAEASLRLLQDREHALEQSRWAREEAERKYGFEATYQSFVSNLLALLENR